MIILIAQQLKKVGLKEYDQLVDDASKETTNLTARYEKYAKAQAWLTDSSLYIPTTTYNGAAAVISRIKPFSGAYAQAGDKGSTYYFKYLNLKIILLLRSNMIRLTKIG